MYTEMYIFVNAQNHQLSEIIVAVSVPAIKLVCLVHPTQRAWYSHKQTRLKCVREKMVNTVKTAI